MTEATSGQLNQTTAEQESTQVTDNLKGSEEEIKLRAEVLDLGIQALLATNANLYNFLIAARQLYFIAVAGLKQQLTASYFSQFLPANAPLPTEEELQIVLNAICQKSTETPEYPSSLLKHHKFMEQVLMPWLRQCVEAEQVFIRREIEQRANERLAKEIDLSELAVQSTLGVPSDINPYLSCVKRKTVTAIAANNSHIANILQDLHEKLKNYGEQNQLNHVLFTDTMEPSFHIHGLANLFRVRAEFKKKSIARLVENHIRLTNTVPDIMVLDLRDSFVCSISQYNTVKRELRTIADRFGVAVLMLFSKEKMLFDSTSGFYTVG